MIILDIELPDIRQVEERSLEVLASQQYIYPNPALDKLYLSEELFNMMK